MVLQHHHSKNWKSMPLWDNGTPTALRAVPYGLPVRFRAAAFYLLGIFMGRFLSLYLLIEK
jgi:hypothetical protein